MVKPQNTITCLWEWLNLKILTTPSAKEDVEQLVLSHIAGENAKWYSYPGNQCDSFF